MGRSINNFDEMFNTESEKIVKPIPKPNAGLRKTKRVNSKHIKNKTRRFSRRFNRSIQL